MRKALKTMFSRMSKRFFVVVVFVFFEKLSPMSDAVYRFQPRWDSHVMYGQWLLQISAAL